MKPETTEDILELMSGYIDSAALGVAMELGIFWLLAQEPLTVTDVAQSLNIPLNRCYHWLQMLCKLGLLENTTEFDMVMLCDVGSFSEIFFCMIYEVLNLKGHLVIADKFAPSRTSTPPSRLPSAFLDSLAHPSQSIDFTTTEVIQTRLKRVGFRDVSVAPVLHKDNLPWNIDWIMLEARK